VESVGKFDLQAWGEVVLPLCAQALDVPSFLVLFEKLIVHERSFVRSLSAHILEQRLQGMVTADRSDVDAFVKLYDGFNESLQLYLVEISAGDGMRASTDRVEVLL